MEGYCRWWKTPTRPKVRQMTTCKCPSERHRSLLFAPLLAFPIQNSKNNEHRRSYWRNYRHSSGFCEACDASMLHGAHCQPHRHHADDFFISDARTDGLVKFREIDYVVDLFETNQCSDIHTEIGVFVRDLSAFTAVRVNGIVSKRWWSSKRDSESSSGFSSSTFKRVIRCWALTTGI